MQDPRTSAPTWHPPFCPNGNCLYHNPCRPHWPYHKHGSFRRRSDNRRVQRFFCRHCQTSFSSQTFSTSYWQKRPDLDSLIFLKTVGGMANRQIARALHVAPATVDHKLARLGRHCLLFHDRRMATAPPATALVIDGLETFELSQYFPFHHNLAIEKGTDFLLYFNDSELRRKGRMRPCQRARRQRLERRHGRADPRAIGKAITELLAVTVGGQTGVTVYSDDHPQYRQPVRQQAGVAAHLVTPGREHRDQHNALWEVNLADLLIRHSSANHRRETLAWSKRRQASAERLAIWLVWRNYLCGRRQKQRGSPTPAMARGMAQRPLTVPEVLGERLFVGHGRLSARWTAYYWRQVRTRALARERRHELKYAQ
jgi:transposase-like protein